MKESTTFKFHGGASSYLGVAILSTLIIVFTLGMAYPWALTMKQRWITNNTTINGRKLQFNGSGFQLIGLWIKLWFFCIITVGIYSFWVVPALQRWVVEHTDFVE